MRGTVARALRRAARAEMGADSGVSMKEVVWSGQVLRHHPNSVHAMYLRLKGAWIKAGAAQAQQPKLAEPRVRKPSGHHVKQNSMEPAIIVRPLRFLRDKFPPIEMHDGSIQPHWIVACAKGFANLGNGTAVKNIARYNVHG